MSEGEGVDAVVGLIFGGAIIEESADESALELLAGSEEGAAGRTEPAY